MIRCRLSLELLLVLLDRGSGFDGDDDDYRPCAGGGPARGRVGRMHPTPKKIRGSRQNHIATCKAISAPNKMKIRVSRQNHIATCKSIMYLVAHVRRRPSRSANNIGVERAVGRADRSEAV